MGNGKIGAANIRGINRKYAELIREFEKTIIDMLTKKKENGCIQLNVIRFKVA